MGKKLPSIAKYCKHIYLGMPYIRRVNKTIYKKAINYTERNIYTVALYMYYTEFQRAKYRCHMSLYYEAPIKDTIFDKCLNEQDDY